MQSIGVSDLAFGHAARAAAAGGLTIPDYLESLIIQDAENIADEPPALKPEQRAKVRDGQEDVKAGRVFTPEQVRERLQSEHNAWLQAHPH
jgi:predicted transcriptional regulator